MGNSLKIICIASVVSFFATWSHSDEISDTHAKLDLELDIVDKQLKLYVEKKKLAAAQKTVTKDLKEAVKNELDALGLIFESKIPKISIVSGTLSSGIDPSRSCNAVYYLRHQCNLKVDCDFDINTDANICGFPTIPNEPLLLSLEFKCADETRSAEFRFGAKGYLTCR